MWQEETEVERKEDSKKGHCERCIAMQGHRGLKLQYS